MPVALTNTPHGNGARARTPIVRCVEIIATTARALWANKVAPELAVRAGCSVRAAENYLAGRGMHGDVLARLILSDAGPAFLEALVATQPPSRQKAWRREFENAAMRGLLRQQLRDAREADT